MADILSKSANFLALNGNFELAQKRLDEAIQLNNQLQDKGVKANILYGYAQISKASGNYTQAHAYLQGSLKIKEESGALVDTQWHRVQLGYLAMREGKLYEACDIFLGSAQNFQRDQNQAGDAFSLEGMAGWYVLINKPQDAARLIGWADATRKKINDMRPLLEQTDVNKIVATCVAEMGEVAFSNCYEEGEKMMLDEVVIYALGKFY